MKSFSILGILILLAATCVFLAPAQESPSVNLTDGPPLYGWAHAYKYNSGGQIEYICYARPPIEPYVWTGATLTSIVDSSNTSTATTSTDHGLAVGNVVTIANTLEAVWVAADITSIVDSTNTATITFEEAHGLDTGDIITISGVTTDTDLNGTYSFTKTNDTVGTFTSASVTDDTYDATSDTGMALARGDGDLAGTYIVATVPLSTTFTFTTASVTDGTYDESSLQSISTLAPRTTAAVWKIKRNYYDSTGAFTFSNWAFGEISAKVFASRGLFVCDSASTYTYK